MPSLAAGFLATAEATTRVLGSFLEGDERVYGGSIGTPGAENKGNPIPVPGQTAGGTAGQGSSATATTPAEESKGKPTIPQ